MASVANEYSEFHIDVETESPKKEESPKSPSSRLIRKISSGVMVKTLKKLTKVTPDSKNSRQNREKQKGMDTDSTCSSSQKENHGTKTHDVHKATE